jgi:hypothetical protein
MLPELNMLPKPIKASFLIEVMAEELIDKPSSTYMNEVRNILAAMEANVTRSAHS